MIKNDYRVIHIRVDRIMYEKLKGLETIECPSISHIIRKAIDFYLRDRSQVQIISEVKPLENLKNPKSGATTVVISMRGIDPHAVMLAKRAKRKGLPYDVGLEKYFENGT